MGNTSTVVDSRARKTAQSDADTQDTAAPEPTAVLHTIFSTLSPTIQGDKLTLLIDGARLPVRLTRLQMDAAFVDVQRLYITRVPGARRLKSEDYRTAVQLLLVKLTVQQKKLQQEYDASDLPNKRRNALPDEAADDTMLKELIEGVFCDEERTLLYHKVAVKGESEEEEYQIKPMPLQRSGMPRLTSGYRVESEEGDDLDTLTFYHVSWSKRPDAPATFTEKQLNTGQWLSLTPGIAATSRRKRDFYADVVKSQVDAFDIPFPLAERRTGFHKNVSGWEYFLRDGRKIIADGELVSTGVPIAGYDFQHNRVHYTPWQTFLASQVTAPSQEDVSAFIEWTQQVDERGRLFLLVLAAYRSLISTFVRVQTAALVVADDDISAGDGSSGAGKTTTIDFARGVDGPCPKDSPTECGFNGSLAGIETHIKAVNDLLVSIGDFHFADENPAEREITVWADKIDRFVSSTADGKEIKERSTRELKPRKGTVIGGFLVMDGEKLHPLLLSRLRRVVILHYRRGEIDNYAIHTEWNARQRVHTSIGHAVIRRVIASVNKNETAFIRQVQAEETEYSTELYTRYMDERQDADKELVRSLSLNYARFIGGAWLAERATNATGIVDAAKRHAYEHMSIQAALMANGGPSVINRDWIIETTNLALEQGHGHALGMNEQKLSEHTLGNLKKWGYRDTGSVDTPWLPMGMYMLNLSDDGQTGYFRAHTWMDILKSAAGKGKWTYTERTFPSMLVRLGIVEPEYDKAGNVTQSAQRPTIARKRERRLCVSIDMLRNDTEQEPDEQGTGDDTDHLEI